MAGRGRGPGGLGAGLGLIAGVAALAAGGVAMGLELEKRIVANRLVTHELADTQEPEAAFFSVRSEGPDVTTVDGVVLHTEVDEVAPWAEAGSPLPDDLTIVFVHGYALSLDCWHFQRLHFRGRAKIVLYDQRSHGRSGRSAPEHCRLADLAADLVQVLDEVVGAGRVVLVGHSMGGMTIMRLARTHPELFGERVVGVALISTAGGEMVDYSPIKGLPGRVFGRIAQPLMTTLNRVPELVERSRKAGSDLGYVVTQRMSFGSEVPVTSVEFMSEMLGQTPLQVVSDFYPAFAELDEKEGFGALTGVPVEVIGGRDDMITPVRHTEKLIELMPTADGNVLDHTGHMSMIEHPHTVNALLDQLVDRSVAEPSAEQPS
ncbi:MAG: alpha/beta fold hydrolase [Propionibacteriaceae bacterium]